MLVRASREAEVALGLKPGTTLEEFEQAIRDKRAEELLNWVDVHAGDMLYVAAGTVHTISGGLILVETQRPRTSLIAFMTTGVRASCTSPKALPRPGYTPTQEKWFGARATRLMFW